MKDLVKALLFWLLISPVFSNSYSIQDSTYYPMQSGNWWEFDASFSPHTETIVDTLRIADKLYYGFARWSEEPEYWLRENDGNVFCLKIKDSTEFLLFDFNAEEGDNWELPAGYECSFGNRITFAGKNDTITTPAGTFYNCYHFLHQPNCADAGMFDTWFAKGVGKVRYIEDFFAGVAEFNLENYSVQTTTDVSQNDLTENLSYKLFQNYPNPFNPETIIGYRLPVPGRVTLKVFNLQGEEVATQVDGYRTAGEHEVKFSAGNLSSGIYYYMMRSGDYSVTKKLIILK